MPTITNGTVEFGRQTRPADYENKSAKVSLSFAVEDGEDAAMVLAQVAGIAQAHALSMVGEKPAEHVFEIHMPKVPKEVEKPYHGLIPPKVPAQPDPLMTNGSYGGDNTLDTSGTTPPSEITDAMLVDVVARARARNVTPDQIKAEIAKLVDHVGASMTTLGPQKRALLRVAVEGLRP